MDAKGRRVRREEAEPLPTEQQGEGGAGPAGGTADEAKGGRVAKKVRKVKVTFSLAEDLARTLGVVASGLGVDQCELVEALIRPLLRGYRQPTIPDELRSLVARDRGAAA